MAHFSSLCGYNDLSEMGMEMVGSYEFSSGQLPPGVTLQGDAWLDDNYGVKLDGEGDSICLGPNSAEGWSDDGDFTIAFSFTKAHCYVPGQYEFLFSTFGKYTGISTTI